MSKYHNKKTMYNGIVYDSKREAARWRELVLMERAGEIDDLQRQVKFVLQEGFNLPNGERVRPITYIADFLYVDRRTNKLIAEDAKGIATQVYKIKKKLFQRKFEYIELREV